MVERVTKRSWPIYGSLGLMLVALGQAFTLVHVRPFSDYWYALCWFGFVLAGDAAVWRRKGRSLVRGGQRDLALMIAASAAGWWCMELGNAALFSNWGYSASPDVPMWAQRLRSTVFFASLIPATWVAALLALSLGWADRRVPFPRWSPSPRALIFIVASGIACAIAARVVKELALPLSLVAIVLLLDPLSFARRRPSLLGSLEAGDARLPIGLVVSSLVAGFVGEAWNYPASPKWTYDVPYIGFAHVFEMPLLGYLGYPLLALAVFALYHFVRGLVPGMRAHADRDDPLGVMGA